MVHSFPRAIFFAVPKFALLLVASSASGQPAPLAAPAGGPILVGPQLLAPPLIPGPRVASDTVVDPSESMPEPASDRMLSLLAMLVRENIPEHFGSDRHWDRTKELYAGIEFRRDGWKLETERRWKTVNHGLWRRYEVDLVNPDETLDVRVSDVYWTADGGLHCRLQIIADLKVLARQARWNLGVQLYNLKVIARSRIRLDIESTIRFRLDPGALPPDLVIEPRVVQASLTMHSFELDRIGKIGGDVAEELGDAVEGLIRDELVKPQSEKLAEKLNQQIDKHRDHLRIAVGDWMTDWLRAERPM